MSRSKETLPTGEVAPWSMAAAKGVILLADGDPRTAPMMDLAVHHLELPYRLIGMPNGQEIIRYLQREGRYADERRFPFPQLLLLDLDIKRVSAFDLLKWIRGSAVARHLTVLVLAKTVFDPDIARAYAMGANSFLVKAQGYGRILQQFRGIEEEWLRKPAAANKGSPNERTTQPRDTQRASEKEDRNGNAKTEAKRWL